MIKIVTFWEKLPKSKRPACKSYSPVLDAVQDPLAVAKFEFFSFFAGQFKPFLVAYQTDNPMVPFLYQDLSNLIRKIMHLVVKPDLLSECQTGRELKKVDLSDKNTFLKPKDINIGFAARSQINELKKKDSVSKADITAFFNGVIPFITGALEKMFERSPIGSVVVLHASVLNPTFISQEKAEVLESKMKKLLAHFLKLKVFTAHVCDRAIDEYSQLIGDALIKVKFQEFDRSETRLDDFYFKIIGIKQYPNLARVVKLVLTLSHGQASVERQFSVNNSVLDVNMKEDSIVARKLIRDHMLAHSLTPESFTITKPLITSCVNAHRKYQEHLKTVQKTAEQEKASNDMKILLEEINATQASRDKLIKTSTSLDNEFVSCVQQAESVKDMSQISTLISKANALKRRSDELRQDASKLDEAIELLKAKKRKLQH